MHQGDPKSVLPFQALITLCSSHYVQCSIVTYMYYTHKIVYTDAHVCTRTLMHTPAPLQLLLVTVTGSTEGVSHSGVKPISLHWEE